MLGTSDWHLEDRLCLENEIDTFIEYVLKRPNRFVVINGDIFNVAIKNSKTGPYNQRMSLQEAKKLAKEKLSKIKQRILLIKPGNHEIRIEKEVDLDVMCDLACELGLEDKYVREAGVLAIEYKKQLFTIDIAHGNGGGSTIGAKANKLAKRKDIVCNADVYIIGHIHEVMAFPKKTFYFDKATMTVKEMEHLFVSLNAFLKFGGYGYDLGLTPTVTRFPYIRLSVEGDRKHINCNVGISNA